MKTLRKSTLPAAVLLLVSCCPLASGQQLKETSTVTIKIVDPVGAPIPLAHMRIVPYPLELSRKLETNAKGVVSVELYPGHYELFVRAANFRSSSRPFDVTDEKSQIVTETLQVGGGSFVEVPTWPRSSDEEHVSAMENALWKYVAGLDVENYEALWDPKAVAWRDEGYFKTGGQDAVAWLRNYKAGELQLDEYTLGPIAVRVSGTTAVAYYNVSTLWLDKFGRGATKRYRIGHTWSNAHGHWRIVGEIAVSN